MTIEYSILGLKLKVQLFFDRKGWETKYRLLGWLDFYLELQFILVDGVFDFYLSICNLMIITLNSR